MNNFTETHSEVVPEADGDGSGGYSADTAGEPQKSCRGTDEKMYGRGQNPNSRKNLLQGEEGSSAKEALSMESQDVLTAMKHVVAGRPIETYQQQELRRWLRKSRDKFMTEFMALEKAARERRYRQRSRRG